MSIPNFHRGPRGSDSSPARGGTGDKVTPLQDLPTDTTSRTGLTGPVRSSVENAGTNPCPLCQPHSKCTVCFSHWSINKNFTEEKNGLATSESARSH